MDQQQQLAEFLLALAAKYDPALIPLVVIVAPIVVKVVDFIKSKRPDLQGNVIQTIAAGVAAVAVVAQMVLAGWFNDGLTLREGAGGVIVWALTAGFSTAVNEWVKDRNDAVRRGPDGKFHKRAS